MNRNNKSDTASEVVWIGLVEARPTRRDTLLGECPGAHVNALVLAEGARDFEVLVEFELEQMGLTAVAFEDVEEFEAATQREQLTAEFIALAKAAQESGECQFTTFRIYEREDY